MARSGTSAKQLELPLEPDPHNIPIRYGSRGQLAEIHCRYWGPISARSLERWNLPWRTSNGRAVAPVQEFIAEAERRFAASAVVQAGYTKPNKDHSV